MSRPILGVDEQVQAALVAAQLDFAANREIHALLADIQVELRQILESIEKRSTDPVERPSRRPNRADIDLLRKQNASIVNELSRLITVVAALLDEQHFTSVARVRMLQDSIMDRLAVIDALTAKVAAVEESLRST